MRLYHALIVLAAVVVAGASCETPADQLLIYVDTDAPMPPAGGGHEPGAPAPLFDRLRIEIRAPGSDRPCNGCVHEHLLDRDLVAARRASFGVPMPPASGYRAHLQLFLGALAQDGPSRDTSIEAWVELPTPPPAGVQEYTVWMPTDDVARPRSTAEAPARLEPGPPPIDRPRVWEPGRRIPCAREPREGEACVPGGAFWMGNARVSRAVLPAEGAEGERVVVLSPFFIDFTR